MALHHTFEKLQRSPAIPSFRRKSFEQLAFMIYRTPQAMRLAYNPHSHLAQMPAPVRI
jgi:hypothetical protein